MDIEGNFGAWERLALWSRSGLIFGFSCQTCSVVASFIIIASWMSAQDAITIIGGDLDWLLTVVVTAPVTLVLVICIYWVINTCFKTTKNATSDMLKTAKNARSIYFITMSLLMSVPLFMFIYTIITISVLDYTQVKQDVKTGMYTTLELYNNKTYTNVTMSNKAWDDFQYNNTCCGVNNYTDWGLHGLKLPRSCCQNSTQTCDSTSCFDKGCFDVLWQDLKLSLNTLFIVSITCLSLIVILSVVLIIVTIKRVTFVSLYEYCVTARQRRQGYDRIGGINTAASTSSFAPYDT